MRLLISLERATASFDDLVLGESLTKSREYIPRDELDKGIMSPELSPKKELREAALHIAARETESSWWKLSCQRRKFVRSIWT